LVIQTSLQYITSGDPEIIFAGLHSLNLGLRAGWTIAAPFCTNRPFFTQLFGLLADPLLEPSSQDCALPILQICLNGAPTCGQFIIWDNVDLIVSILPTAAAADLLAVLCRVLQATIEYLSVIHFPSILLTLLTEVCGFPAAQSPLLKLMTLTYDDLLFSDTDWAAFFLAMRDVNGGERIRTFGMLRVVGEERAAAWPELSDPSRKSLKGLSALAKQESLELLKSLAAIEDCPASAMAAALLGQFWVRDGLNRKILLLFCLFLVGEFNRLRIRERNQIGFLRLGEVHWHRTRVEPAKKNAGVDWQCSLFAARLQGDPILPWTGARIAVGERAKPLGAKTLGNQTNSWGNSNDLPGTVASADC
jgi:hypothetical protein